MGANLGLITGPSEVSDSEDEDEETSTTSSTTTTSTDNRSKEDADASGVPPGLPPVIRLSGGAQADPTLSTAAEHPPVTADADNEEVDFDAVTNDAVSVGEDEDGNVSSSFSPATAQYKVNYLSLLNRIP